MASREAKPDTSSSIGDDGEAHGPYGSSPHRASVAAKRGAADRLPFPTATEIAVLHERVVAGHPYAVEALIERVLPVLEGLLRRSFPKTSDDLIANAVEDALLDYSKRPMQFDRSHGVPLLAFLRLAASRNLANLRRGEARRLKREERYIRERSTSDPNVRWREWSAERAEAPQIALSGLLDDGLIDVAKTMEGREATAQWFQGERRTGHLAQALGIEHLPVIEQRRGVRRFKERIRQRLKRLLSNMKA